MHVCKYVYMTIIYLDEVSLLKIIDLLKKQEQDKNNK